MKHCQILKKEESMINFGADGPQGFGGMGGGYSSGFSDFGDMGDLGDILSSMFGGGFRR